MYRSCPFWGANFFFYGRSYVLILTKTGWATFWPIFSQTHLVTHFVMLAGARLGFENKLRFGLAS
jgi:hypothetical protein